MDVVHGLPGGVRHCAATKAADKVIAHIKCHADHHGHQWIRPHLSLRFLRGHSQPDVEVEQWGTLYGPVVLGLPGGVRQCER